MIRTFILTGAVVTTLLAAACDNNAATDQQKAVKAQQEANDKAAAATKEATDKTVNAQAEADKKIAEAQASFTKLREDYRHKTTTDLADMDKKIADLDAKAKTATGKAKTDLSAKLVQIHANRDAFAKDWSTLDSSTATTWDGTKARLDKEWSDLKSLVDSA